MPLWGEGRGKGRGAGHARPRRRTPALLPRPSGERAGVRGWALDSSLWFDAWMTPLLSAGRDMRPAAQSLSLSRQRKEPKKGDPTGRVPSLRSRRSNNRSKSDHEAWACCAAHARPRPCASRHGQRGGEHPHGSSLRSTPRTAEPWAERSDGPNGFATPLRLRLRRRACGVARAPQDARAAWSDSRGLFERRERSERSEFLRAPRKGCGAGLPQSEAQGSQTWGRFLLPPFLVHTRKGGALPGACPGRRKEAASTKHRTTANISNASCPSPQPSPQRGEGARQVYVAAGGRVQRPAPHPNPLPNGAREQGLT